MWVELGCKGFPSSFLSTKNRRYIFFYSDSVWNLRAACLSALPGAVNRIVILTN